MPIPLLLIGVVAATGAVGVGKSIKAGSDAYTASKINKDADEMVRKATELVNTHRSACGRALSNLGEEKLFVLNNSIREFLDVFTKIKNVDFRESKGLDELGKLHIDKKEFEQLESMTNFAGSFALGAAGGTASGALAALGAYGAAQTLAMASTGTAIASLSGAAATNATLAFFGGGALAAGGLGMAGGAVILGGLVAGPALMIMGIVAGNTAKKNLDKAMINKAEALEIAQQLSTAALECELIRRRVYVFYNLLARLDTYFMPLIYKLEDIFKDEGDNYKLYKKESKSVVASCASIAVTIKTILDTPLLTDDGKLTEESSKVAILTKESLDKMV